MKGPIYFSDDLAFNSPHSPTHDTTRQLEKAKLVLGKVPPSTHSHFCPTTTHFQSLLLHS